MSGLTLERSPAFMAGMAEFAPTAIKFKAELHPLR